MHGYVRQFDVRNGRFLEVVDLSEAGEQEYFQIVIVTCLYIVNQILFEPFEAVYQLLEVCLFEMGALIVLFRLD